jgi:hypothetical protein
MSKFKNNTNKKSNNINIIQHSKKIQETFQLHGDSIFCSHKESFLSKY